MAVVSSYREN